MLPGVFHLMGLKLSSFFQWYQPSHASLARFVGDAYSVFSCFSHTSHSSVAVPSVLPLSAAIALVASSAFAKMIHAVSLAFPNFSIHLVLATASKCSLSSFHVTSSVRPPTHTFWSSFAFLNSTLN